MTLLPLLLSLIILIASAKLGGLITYRLRQPAVLGELLVGLLLGPSMIDLFHQRLLLTPTLPGFLEETIFDLAELGVIFLMFLAGLEVEVKEMAKTGRVAMRSGVLGVLLPLLLGAGVGALFGYSSRSALFIGVTLTATSVSISAQTLLQLKKLRSREGLALLGAAIVDDVLVILILSLFLAFTDGNGGHASLMMVVIKMVLYLLASGLVAYAVLPRLAQWADRQPVSEGLTSLVVIVALFFAWTAEEWGGLAAITGAFIAGVGLGRSSLRDKIERSMHAITYAFFVPIFFVSIGLHTDLHQMSSGAIPFAALLILAAIVGKVIGCGLGAKSSGFTWSEALRVGLGMISRGEVGLIVATVGITNGLITTEVFSVVTLLVLFTTLITPPLLRLSYAKSKEG